MLVLCSALVALAERPPKGDPTECEGEYFARLPQEQRAPSPWQRATDTLFQASEASQAARRVSELC